jgi:hemoglobin
LDETIFQRCGGFAVVRRIVSAFYGRMLASPRLSTYFAAIEIPRLIDHQTQFVTQAMGGPAQLPDRQLARAHADLGISAEEFAEMVELLRGTLEEAGLPPQDIAEVVGQVRRREHLIVAPS